MLRVPFGEVRSRGEPPQLQHGCVIPGQVDRRGVPGGSRVALQTRWRLGPGRRLPPRGGRRRSGLLPQGSYLRDVRLGKITGGARSGMRHPNRAWGPRLHPSDQDAHLPLHEVGDGPGGLRRDSRLGPPMAARDPGLRSWGLTALPLAGARSEEGRPRQASGDRRGPIPRRPHTVGDGSGPERVRPRSRRHALEGSEQMRLADQHNPGGAPRRRLPDHVLHRVDRGDHPVRKEA